MSKGYHSKYILKDWISSTCPQSANVNKRQTEFKWSARFVCSQESQTSRAGANNFCSVPEGGHQYCCQFCFDVTVSDCWYTFHSLFRTTRQRSNSNIWNTYNSNTYIYIYIYEIDMCKDMLQVLFSKRISKVRVVNLYLKCHQHATSLKRGDSQLRV